MAYAEKYDYDFKDFSTEGKLRALEVWTGCTLHDIAVSPAVWDEYIQLTTSFDKDDPRIRACVKKIERNTMRAIAEEGLEPVEVVRKRAMNMLKKQKELELKRRKMWEKKANEYGKYQTIPLIFEKADAFDRQIPKSVRGLRHSIYTNKLVFYVFAYHSGKVEKPIKLKKSEMAFCNAVSEYIGCKPIYGKNRVAYKTNLEKCDPQSAKYDSNSEFVLSLVDLNNKIKKHFEKSSYVVTM